VRNDVRDHLVSQKNDHGLSYWRYAHPSGGLVQKSTFARFLEFFDFRLFQQYRHLSDMSGRADDVCCWGAGSTDRRNTFGELLSWGLIEQGLSRPFIELPCDRVELGLAVQGQIGAPRKILAQQSVGVFA